MISRIISDIGERLLVRDGPLAQGDTMVPIEVSRCESDNICLAVIPLTTNTWAERRRRYAQFLLDDKQASLLPEQKAYLQYMFRKVYGACDTKALENFSSPTFEEPEVVILFLASEKSFAFRLPQDVSYIRECISCYGAEGGLHYLVDHIELKGKFEIPESITIVDLPGMADVTKTKWWVDDLNRQLAKLNQIWWLTDAERTQATGYIKQIAEVLHLQGKPTYLFAGRRDTKTQKQTDQIAELYRHYSTTVKEVTLQEKVLYSGGYVILQR